MAIWNTLDANLSRTINGDLRLRQHTSKFNKLRGFATDILTAKDKAGKNGTLNEKGLAEAALDFAKTHVASELRQEVIRHRDAIKNLNERRTALVSPKIDKNDVIGFLKRQELRSQIRMMDDSKKIARLTIEPDSELVAAVIEDSTGLLTGVSDSVRTMMVNAYLETSHADEAAFLRREAEVLDVVSLGLETSTKEVREALGLSKADFDEWLVEVTPELNGKPATVGPDVDFLVDQVSALRDWPSRQRVMDAMTDGI
jgi:hypothetical protein